jgi:hypothetical protein
VLPEPERHGVAAMMEPENVYGATTPQEQPTSKEEQATVGPQTSGEIVAPPAEGVISDKEPLKGKKAPRKSKKTPPQNVV